MRLDLAETCTAVMLQIALNQPDPADRISMLGIMRYDGMLSGEQFARLVESVVR